MHTTDIDQEEQMMFSRRPIRFEIPIEEIRACKTAGEAFALACFASGMTDKQIQADVDINQGYFSNIISNKATLQADKEALFCRVVGNTAYPQWRAHQIDAALVSTERLASLEASEAYVQELERKLDFAMTLLNQRLKAA